MKQNEHTYQVYSNEEMEVTYYVKEFGMSKEGFKKFYVIQAHNRESIEYNEFELEDLKKLLNLQFTGIKPEREVLREQTEALRNDRSNWADLA